MELTEPGRESTLVEGVTPIKGVLNISRNDHRGEVHTDWGTIIVCAPNAGVYFEAESMLDPRDKSTFKLYMFKLLIACCDPPWPNNLLEWEKKNPFVVKAIWNELQGLIGMEKKHCGCSPAFMPAPADGPDLPTVQIPSSCGSKGDPNGSIVGGD